MGTLMSRPGEHPSIPRSFDLSKKRWVYNPMPERRDERHVYIPEPTAWLDVNGHLSAVAAVALIDPSQVHHGVHGLVGQFSGPFDVGAIQRLEWQGAEIQIRRRAAQIIWQSVGQ